MGKDRLQEMYAPLVEEGAAEFLYDDTGNVVAVCLTRVDPVKLADVERSYAETFDAIAAKRDRLQREARVELERKGFKIDF